MSKYKLIRINSKEDINTSKVSVYDLNNRYLDTNGTMYALKYNRLEKKIEIIPLLMTHIKNASTIHHQVIQKKINDNMAILNDKSNSEDTISNESTEIEFNPDLFINDSLSLMKTHRDRLKGIMMNIKNSNIISTTDKTDSTTLDDHFRSIDLDGIQKIEKIEKYHKELTEYPRSITYYQAKLDKQAKEQIDKLSTSKDKMMKFIYYYEMHSQLSDFYKSIGKFITNLRDFIETKDIEELSLSKYENQSFEDAMLSIETTINEIDDVIQDSNKLYSFTLNADNFTELI